MIFNHRLFWLLLPCSLTSLSTISFSSAELSNQNQSKNYDSDNLDFDEELKILSKIGTSDSFLEFSDSDKKSLEDIIKSYLKTTTGAKILSQRLTQHLIVNLIESYKTSESSVTKEKLRNSLTSLKNRSNLSDLSGKEKKEAKILFGNDEQAYKDDQVRVNSRGIFERVLNEVLNSLAKDTGGKEFESSDPDPFIKLFAGFWNHVLDDYLKHERPIPFKKLTWNYDKAERKQDIQELFAGSDSSLPSKASYHFPLISNESKEKFNKFLEKIKDNKSKEQKFKDFSDESDIDLVIPISSLANGAYTSQFTVSALEVFDYLISGSVNKLQKKFLRDTEKTETKKCEVSPSGIFEHYIEEITKEPKELFCVEKKDESNNKGISDFVYLIQKQEKQPSWILFKDKQGIHALTYNSEVFSENKYDSDKLKKHLIENEKLDLKDNLSKYLGKHFERLILGYWDKFFTLKPQPQEQKDQAKKLSELLLRESFANDLVSLRKALLRDYLDIFNSSLKSNNGLLKPEDWQLKFVGKFPYELSQNQKEGSEAWGIFKSFVNTLVHVGSGKRMTDTFIPHLEKAFLLDPTKSYQFSRLPDKLDPVLQLNQADPFLGFKDAFASYSNSIDRLFWKFKTQTQTQRENKDNLHFFKFNNLIKEVNKDIFEIKEIQNKDLFESVWASLRKDKKLSEVLFKEKIEKDVDFFNFDSWKLKKWEIEWTNSIQFKGSTGSKNSEDLIFNYLHSEYIELTKDLNIPQILGDFDFGNTTDKKKLKSYLEKTVKKFKDTLSSSGSDVSKGGALIDLFTIKWLAENDFENFRLNLRDTLKRDSLTAFTFSKKFSEADKCLPKSYEKASKSENLELKSINHKPSHVFGWSDGGKKEFSCLLNSDALNFASVTTEDGKSKHLTGYKGLVNGNWKEFFSDDIVAKLQHSSALWKDSQSLINYIGDSIHSESKYEELINTLKAVFPKHNWNLDFEKQCHGFRFDWRSSFRGQSCSNAGNTSLEDKKEALKKHLREKKILDKESFKSKNGWFEDEKGDYLITNKDGVQYQIYLIQIKYDDVLDKESWKSYLKTIDNSYFFKELIKTAKDPKVQKQALIGKITSEKGSLKGLKTGDDRLKKLLGYSWLDNKQ